MRLRVPLVAVVAALGLLAAGCGAGSPTTATTTPATGLVAYAGCMRSNGVVRFPDPASGGAIPKESLQQLGVSGSRFQSAESVCRRLLPNGGSGPRPAQAQEVKARSLRFARCVRAHGVPNFPDPDSTGRIPDPASAGVDQGAPRFQAANQACGRFRPPYMPSNAAYDAYARSNG